MVAQTCFFKTSITAKPYKKDKLESNEIDLPTGGKWEQTSKNGEWEGGSRVKGVTLL